MATFVKAQASSIVASIFDFLTTIVCKEFFYLWYLSASLIGTLTGGIINFGLGRNWVFKRKENTIPKQAVKYFLVWGGNIVLTTAGVFFVTHYIGLSYIASKVIVSISLGVSYNYFMQKKFVFA
ncbi:GtrA family protein [Mucilaginibacter segetis]|uniref:GtrA family protein n=1 Tax=Mucilaginibacter segetis TaxID=2793071 RepID=A0A934PRG6_9SPHI|nr:GtrA family protein [Mucilaginibacter segetis]MBK0378764.1 GtrA family protein [Mucilaginibacter segetis]